MRTRRLAACVAVGLLALGAACTGAGAAPTTTTLGPASGGVSITAPQSGDTVVNTHLQVSGTAPANVLVSVGIVDTDTSRGNLAHQPSGRVDGSVTSGADGGWVFVPQVAIVPGAFAVTASYTTNANQTIASQAVSFVVVNASGESAVAGSSLKWKVALTVIAVALLAAAGLWYRSRRSGAALFAPPAWLRARRERAAHEMERYDAYPELRPSTEATPHPALRRPTPEAPRPAARRPSARRPRAQARSPERAEPEPERDEPEPDDREPENQPLFMNTAEGRTFQRDQTRKLRHMDDDMKSVQRALAGTAEALERSYSTIAALRHQISDELAANAPDPADDETTKQT